VITDATPGNPNGSCEKVVRRAPGAHRMSEPTGGPDPREPKDR
jgi:hypothetical protein